MKPLSFCILFPFFLLFFFFYFGLHQNREDIFLLLSILENVIDYLSAFVEFGLAMLKVEFESFFSMPFVCPPFSPSIGVRTRLVVTTSCH